MFLVADISANQEPTFTKTKAKLYALVITLSTQDNAKLLKQLGSGFERTITLNKYQSKKSEQTQNRYLDFLQWSRFSISK